MYIDIHVKYPYFRQILIKLKFSRQISENRSDIKCHGNTPSGGRVIPCGRTDRRDEDNSRLSKPCERVQRLSTFRNFLLCGLGKGVCYTATNAKA